MMLEDLLLIFIILLVKATKQGMCLNRNCLTPKPCPNLRVSHQDYLDILKDLRKLDGVKRSL